MIFLFGARLKFTLDKLKGLEQSNSALSSQVQFLKESLELERIERVKLQDAILIRTGFVPGKTPTVVKETPKPVGNEIKSWPRRRIELEQESLKRAKGKVEHTPEEIKKAVDEMSTLIDNEERKENAS